MRSPKLLRVAGLGFGVSGLGFGVSGLGFRGLGFRVSWASKTSIASQ